MEEWYHVAEQPEGVACTDNNCSCVPDGAPASDTSNFLSYRSGGDTVINIDIIEDPDFPEDLFKIFFGVSRILYGGVKGNAAQKTDCTDLGPGSNGVIWITGPTCTINGTVVGSALAPVILVSAADVTAVNGGAIIFGVLYIFDDDADSPGATLKSTGGATVYGATIVDGEIDKLQGTFQVVYNNAILATASGIKGVGSINGGWRDFGLPEITW
jgi:hypothetical protein